MAVMAQTLEKTIRRKLRSMKKSLERAKRLFYVQTARGRDKCPELFMPWNALLQFGAVFNNE
jgi:hypothetical protein